MPNKFSRSEDQRKPIYHSLTIRILSLVLLPALLLGAGMIWQANNANLNIKTSMNELSEKSESLISTQATVQNILISTNGVLLAVTSLSNTHQSGLLMNDKKLVEKNEKNIANLQATILKFEKTIQKLTNVKQTVLQFNDADLNRKYFYILRAGNNINKLINIALESHARTNELLKKRNIQKARINYLFEERFRISAALNRVKRTSKILGIMSSKLQEKALQDYQASRQAIIDNNARIGKIIISIVITGLILVLAISITVSMITITRPMKTVVEALTSLASGNLEVVLPKSKINEIGSLASSMQVFKNNILETKRLSEETEKQRAKSEEQQRASMHQLADGFEQSIGSIVNNVSSGANMQRSSAEALSTSVSDMSKQSSDVMNAAGEADNGIQTIATAAEELASSVQEIGLQADKSEEKSVEVSTANKQTVEQVKKLSETAEKIGSIVNLIQDIAGQTNLLALNATIEAARAGEAGKGFAVVASEVKNLASQTEKATSEISAQIMDIQEGTEASLNAIENSAEVIEELSTISRTIASAVREQAGATDEIAKNVSFFAENNKNVTNNIGSISEATGGLSQSSNEMLNSADELSKTADNLSAEVTEFLNTVRSA